MKENVKNPDSNKKPSIKKSSKNVKDIKKTLRIVGTVILSIVLVVIITGSILATSFTVYIMKFMNTADAIDISQDNIGNTTSFYALDKDGKYQLIETLSGQKKRVWVDIEKVPKIVQDAFVYTEDERFYDHEGVDFKRTFSAFANLFLNIYDTQQGGSTITQQVVRNVSGDNSEQVDRKVREIFRAMNLEKAYTKTDILESYLNIVPQGGTRYGVQTGANYFFNKDISQVTIKEAAYLAAMAKSPIYYNPQKYLKESTDRANYVIKKMYDNGAISTDEYNNAVKEEVKFTFGLGSADTGTVKSTATSYFVDSTFNQVVSDFMAQYNISKDEAISRLRSGGYKIYTTQNPTIQAQMDAKFKEPATFTTNKTIQANITDKFINNNPDFKPNKNQDPPQASGIIMDYNGNILGVVGGIGTKTESLGFNRAVDAMRSPGSCIKPLTSYGPSIMLDQINWSSKFIDQPIQVVDPKTGLMVPFTVKDDKTGEDRPWPSNFDKKYDHPNVFTWDVLKKSLNTAAANMVEKLKPQTSYDFMTQKLHFTTLIPSDIDRSPMAVGALGNGVKLSELVAAYQIFGNMGQYRQPTFYTKVTDADGNVILEHKYVTETAMDADSAYVMNRLMRNVISPGGTGYNASLGVKDVEIIGKTGTAMNTTDLTFVGCTPDYISGVWYGYDKPDTIPDGIYVSSASFWNNVFKEIVNNEPTKTFAVNNNVLKLNYCTITGDLAGPNCPSAEGYYKKSFYPKTCDGNH